MAKHPSSLALKATFAGEATRSLAGFGESELRLLRTFAIVVAAGGFSVAAAELQVDLSTISKQFRELEAWLGVTLARRGRGGFVLTAEGERLQALASRFFAGMQAFSQDLSALGAQQTPVLRLGIVDALLTALPLADGHDLPAVIARCVDAMPGLQLQMATLRPLQIERDLLAGALDAGLIAAHPPAAGLEQHRLYAEPNSLYVGPGHAWHRQPAREIPSDELAAAAFVTDPYSAMIPHAELAPILARGAQTRADSIEGVALLVASGRFAGFLPDHLVSGTASLKALRRVMPARFSYSQDIVLTCRAGNVNPAVRRLIRWLSARSG
jgi:LysR family transcriptional regulator, transcriptional activator for bauABCD operon